VTGYGVSTGVNLDSISDESRLRDKLRKIEALFARAGGEGERLAAGAALVRVRTRLAAMRRNEPAAQMQFSLADEWSRRLFLALCRRYGLEPYRLYRQRASTVMLRAPKGFVEQVLWPEFEELNAALGQFVNAITLRLIREEVHGDASEAAELTHVTPVAAVSG